MKRRAPRTAGQVLLRQADGEGFQTNDVINGLHGICEVLDERADDLDISVIHELSTAAKVLSSILQNRATS
jgi:hypothetical protein